MNTELSPRERILQTALHLVEQKGYHATGINEIIKLSQTPKGSLYHYFPEGKADLVAQAIQMKADFIQARISESLASSDDPATAIQHHILQLAERLEAFKCQVSWSPFASIALEATAENDELRQLVNHCFGAAQKLIADKLMASGFSENRAQELAITVGASIQGGIILSRAQQNAAPLRQVAKTLFYLIQNYPK